MKARFSVTAAIAAVTAAVLVCATSLFPAGAAEPARRPIIFVHGFAGSASQFEAQAMRFASNGYPVDSIEAHEYDTTLGSETPSDIWARLDTRIAELSAATGADQVDLLGHSMGTGLMQGYLNSDPARAANVAHYVNLDGATATEPPGGVPTMAVWGAGDPTREITGATNVYFSNQTHTQVVTSPETFEAVFEFFNGEPPTTRNVIAQRAGEVTIEGRAQLFLTNAGVQDATLDIYEVDGSTGMRIDETPEASFAMTGDGGWGPFAPDPSAYYEFALSRDTGAQHIYMQPFVRTNHLVRLLSSEPDTGVDALWDKGEGHSNLVVIRNKEWWGDQPGANDVLEIDGTGIVNAATAPQSKRAIGIFVYDRGADGLSDTTAPIPTFFGLPFLTGVDLHMAASSPPQATIAIVATPRLGNGVETINVPNWASASDRITVQFRDFHVIEAAPDDPSTNGDGSNGSASPTSATAPSPTANPSFTG
jgi:hypothetical protein